MSEPNPSLARDMLRGAGEIAEFLFDDPNARRKVYHLVATSRLPHFKLGSMIYARKSTLRRFIEDQEQRRPAHLP